MLMMKVRFKDNHMCCPTKTCSFSTKNGKNGHTANWKLLRSKPRKTTVLSTRQKVHPSWWNQKLILRHQCAKHVTVTALHTLGRKHSSQLSFFGLGVSSFMTLAAFAAIFSIPSASAALSCHRKKCGFRNDRRHEHKGSPSSWAVKYVLSDASSLNNSVLFLQ